MGRGFFGSVVSVLYVIVGLIVAANRHYFAHLSALKPVISAVLAILLWPLLLLGVSLHIH